MKKGKKMYCKNCVHCIQITIMYDVICGNNAYETEREGDIPPYHIEKEGFQATMMHMPLHCKYYAKKSKGMQFYKGERK